MLEYRVAYRNGDDGWIVAIVLDFPAPTAWASRCDPRGGSTAARKIDRLLANARSQK